MIGVAHTKRECWVLAGFEPRDDEESNRLAELGNELGFDPRKKAEKLTAREPSAKRSAKRVLNALTGGDQDREAQCWKKTDLSILERQGKNTGLADYLNDLKQRLVPLFKPGPPSA